MARRGMAGKIEGYFIAVLIYIGLGGILGTFARYYMQGWVQVRLGAATFPIGTLAVNLVGSFVLGFVLRAATGSTLISPDVRAGLSVGFCGAFTTMSTFSYESMKLLSDGEYWFASLYI